jgi:uncharacterized protein (DUF1501 family)
MNTRQSSRSSALDSSTALTFNPKSADVLICIFQRGGADGLNMVVPHGDKDYYAHRASLAIPQPGASGSAIDLDGFFGLHPALGALKESWDANLSRVGHASWLGAANAGGAFDHGKAQPGFLPTKRWRTVPG